MDLQLEGSVPLFGSSIRTTTRCSHVRLVDDAGRVWARRINGAAQACCRRSCDPGFRVFTDQPDDIPATATALLQFREALGLPVAVKCICVVKRGIGRKRIDSTRLTVSTCKRYDADWHDGMVAL